jgi:hypothetical protein
MQPNICIQITYIYAITHFNLYIYSQGSEILFRKYSGAHRNRRNSENSDQLPLEI